MVVDFLLCLDLYKLILNISMIIINGISEPIQKYT